MAVCITANKGPQDHHVQGALEHFILWLAAFPHRSLHSDFYGKESYTTRTSMGISKIEQGLD
jgi:hypothetical protein